MIEASITMTSNKRARLDGNGSILETETPTISNNSKAQPTRACAECKKLKTKCFVAPGQRSCNKCLKNGIECVPHNFAQKFMDEDAMYAGRTCLAVEKSNSTHSWKSQATATIARLEAAVEQLLHHNDLLGLATYGSTSVAPKNGPEIEIPDQVLKASDSSHSVAPVSGNFTSEGPSADLQEEEDAHLVPLPMDNLYSLTVPGTSRLIGVDASTVNGPDFISRGVVSITEAEYLFERFRDRINPLLWDGILCAHKSLSEARKSSSLLVAVALTVAAFHIPNQEKTLHAAYGAFISLMRASCMLHTRNLDDIRGLCIGAFYLTSLSWSLCSRAVRVATEMNLHKSSLEFARGSIESYERVRLWYVLYVCDHQFALAYGRLPMMHEDAAIRNADKLLTSGLSSKGDGALVAHVKLFRILAGAYFMYGCDPDLQLSGEDFERLQSFNISLDQWRLESQPKSVMDPITKEGLIPSKVATLYYQLARFWMNSMSLRGISARQSLQHISGPDMSWDRQETANNAITAATNTIRLIVEDTDVRNALFGMPIFTHAMIAVCSSFLLKMAVAFGEPMTGNSPFLRLPSDLTKYGLNFHTQKALTNVENLVSVLNLVGETASQRHVISQVIMGLKELLQRFSADENDSWLYSASKSLTASVHTDLTSHGNTTSTSEDHPEMLENDSSSNHIYTNTNLSHATESTTAATIDPQQDPFDIMGDLDWRFNDGFLWGMDSETSYM